MGQRVSAAHRDRQQQIRKWYRCLCHSVTHEASRTALACCSAEEDLRGAARRRQHPAGGAVAQKVAHLQDRSAMRVRHSDLMSSYSKDEVNELLLLETGALL